MQQSYQFKPEILREYDIRGRLDVDITAIDAYYVGRAFGTYIARMKGSRICVGYDGRHSSPDLRDALIKGLRECGIDVCEIGLGPSPMLYFAVKDMMADAGVMITGSHNPSDYNGFKMMTLRGPVFADDIQEIGRIAATGVFAQGDGALRHMDIQDIYVQRLLRSYDDVDHPRSYKIVWDCGNGAAGDVMRMLVSQGGLPGEHILLYDEIDGDFPNHHPDPTVDANMRDLQAAVLSHGADMGFAFDGDADRIGAVDNLGQIVRCDTMLAVYAHSVLKQHPGAPIIGDVKCSQGLYDVIDKLGGRSIMWKTGHSPIKAKMMEERAPLAGELSGHIFFADRFYGYDDGLYNAIRLINEVSLRRTSLSEITAELPALLNTPEIRFDVDEALKFNIVRQACEYARTLSGVEIFDLDGIRVSTEDGWWLLRASNTQNSLVVRAEAYHAEGLDRLRDMVDDVCHHVGVSVPWGAQ